MISPDGLHWTPHSQRPICRGSDVITGYFDAGRRRYVAFPKIAASVHGFRRRCFWLITSGDFETWTEPRLVLAPDEADDAGAAARIEPVRPLLDVPDDAALIRTEFYGVGAYVAESCTVAFPWVFTVSNNARYGNQEGPGELQLAASRDLVHWERPFRSPCVPRGALGAWDCGFFTTAARALRVGDEIRLYYGGSNYTHGTPCLYRAEGTGRGTRYTGAIGLATWPLDRFVSVDGPKSGGTLTTVPLAYTGRRLEINAVARPGGRNVDELRDASGAPLEGLGPSDPFTGDSLRHTVTWSGSQRVDRWAGRPVRLTFRLFDAELYSFAFRQ
jgi:hypothetical protein